jgi:hypothetical protein
MLRILNSESSYSQPLLRISILRFARTHILCRWFQSSATKPACLTTATQWALQNGPLRFVVLIVGLLVQSHLIHRNVDRDSGPNLPGSPQHGPTACKALTQLKHPGPSADLDSNEGPFQVELLKSSLPAQLGYS